MAQSLATKCEICKQNVAKLYCYECKSRLCSDCETFHKKFPTTSGHIVTDFHNIDQLARDNKLVCDKHKQDLVYFCTKCEILICSECATTDHQGHVFKSVVKVVSEIRPSVQTQADDIKVKIKTLSDLIEKVKEENFKQIQKESDNFSNEVKNFSESIISVVNNVTEIKLNLASDFLVLERQHLQYVVAKLEKAHSEHSAFYRRLESVLSLKHDVAFFLNHKNLQNDDWEIPDIKEQRKIDVFDKENFVRELVQQIQEKYNLQRLTSKEEEVDDLVLKLQFEKREAEEAHTESLNQLRKEMEMTFLTEQKEWEDLSMELIEENDRLQLELGPEKIKDVLVCQSLAIYDIRCSSAMKFFNYQTYMNNRLETDINMRRSAVVIQNDNIVAVGADADNLYSDLVEYQESENHYCFRHFRETLYNATQIMNDYNATIIDDFGKEMRVVTLFAAFIRYHKDSLSETVCDLRDNLLYILTMPACLKKTGILLLRKAANKAGIRNEQLRLVEEPVATIVYGLQLDVTENASIKNDKKYIRVNLQDYTADICVYQIHADGLIEELIEPVTGPWCSISLVNAFMDFLKTVFNNQTIDAIKRNDPSEYEDLIGEFETKIRTDLHLVKKTVTIRIPISLSSLVKSPENRNAILNQSKNGKYVSFTAGNTMRIDATNFISLFKPTITDLLKHIDEIFQRIPDVVDILMVGSFAASGTLQHDINEKFGKTKTVIIPPMPEYAVVLGGTLCGFMPQYKLKRFNQSK